MLQKNKLFSTSMILQLKYQQQLPSINQFQVNASF